MARGVGPGTGIKQTDQLWCSWGDEAGAGQVPQDVPASVWPALAAGLEPDGAAGRAGEPRLPVLSGSSGLAPGARCPRSQPCPWLVIGGVTRVQRLALLPETLLSLGPLVSPWIGAWCSPADLPSFLPHLMRSFLPAPGLAVPDVTCSVVSGARLAEHLASPPERGVRQSQRFSVDL